MNHLALGTAAIGRPVYMNVRQESALPFSMESFKAQGKAMLDQAYDQGIRYFDTAPNYGMAEQMIFEWLQTKNDPSIEIATKWGYTYTANFNPNATQHEIKEHSLSKLQEQWAYSKNLMPQLSTYQIHSATFATGVLDNQAILEQLANLEAEHGLRIGLTVTGPDQVGVLRKAITTEVQGKALFSVFQVTYNILDQSLAEIRDLFQAHHRIVIKEGMANGRLFRNSHYPHHAKVYEALDELAQKYSVGIDAIALRFIIDSILPFKVLSGAARPEHLQQNCQAETFTLSTEDLGRLQQFSMAKEAYWTERKNIPWN